MDAKRYTKRRNQLRRALTGDLGFSSEGSNAGADSILITNESNVRYLTGFTGDSSYLLVAKSAAADDILISDPRYEEQIERQCQGLETHIRLPSEFLHRVTGKLFKSRSYRRIAFEASSVSVQLHEQLRQVGSGELVPSAGLVERQRAIKDASEVATIEKAVAIAERTFQALLPQLTPRMTEREVAFELEYLIRKLGGEGCAFAPIVAVGANAALPHAEPGDVPLGDAPLLLLDWGATFEGYRSDLTRCLFTGRAPTKIRKAYQAVLDAQEAAISSLCPGLPGSEADAVVREVLRSAGFEKKFNHGLGHGIGLDIHESPRMGKSFPQQLEPGMVITVEPGVYFPGLGGLRIEDDILITEDGCRVLSSLPKCVDSAEYRWLA
ncbi:MAG: M24 family metallopeptidase [Pirellulaceae bacterium]